MSTSQVSLSSTSESLPAFAVAARASGGTILAFWEHDTTWRVARWNAAPGIEPHWGIDGKWTPGAGPIAFAEMPFLPGQESQRLVSEPQVHPARLEKLRRIEYAAQVVVSKLMRANSIKDSAGFTDPDMRVLYDAIIDGHE